MPDSKEPIMRAERQELGPCGKHPRKIAETPQQAWYRAYESERADKDPAQHCPECDRLAALSRESAPASEPTPVTDDNPDIREIAFDFVGDLGLPEHRSREWLGERTERLVKRIVAVVNKYRVAGPAQADRDDLARYLLTISPSNWQYDHVLELARSLQERQSRLTGLPGKWRKIIADCPPKHRKKWKHVFDAVETCAKEVEAALSATPAQSAKGEVK